MMSKKTIFTVVRHQKDSLGTKLVVKYKGSIIIGELGADKHVVSVCWNLNLLENKAIMNLSVADTYRFTRKYSLFGGVHHQYYLQSELSSSVLFCLSYSFLFLLLLRSYSFCLNNQTE